MKKATLLKIKEQLKTDNDKHLRELGRAISLEQIETLRKICKDINNVD